MDDANIQVPLLRKRFFDYKNYAKAPISELYKGREAAGIPKMVTKELQTSYLENTGNGFAIHQLPIEAQYSPVICSAVQDFNHDGHKDILLLGNNKYNKLRIGKLDANHGVLLTGNGRGGFTYMPQNRSGLKLRDDVRAVTFMDDRLIIGINNRDVKMFRVK